ncbi:MAG: outer membrane protein assembly factor BamD [Candidatus Zixiibacteriota bacterium]
MEDSTFTDRKVIDLSANMVLVRAEAKKDSTIRDRYKIAGYPTIVLMKSSGEEIDRIFGYVPAAEFVTTIQDYLKGINTLEDVKKKFEADPKNVELAFRLAEKYEGREQYDDAGSYYQKVVEIDPDDQKGKSDDALFSLASLEMRKKDYLKAADAFKYFLQKYPKSDMISDAETYIPYCYAKAGDTAQALNLYEKFLVQHPDSPDTDWVKDRIKELKGPKK